MSKSKMIMHHYTICGLPNVWIQCRQLTDDDGEKMVSIPNIRQLHRLIANWVVRKDGALSGAELRFLRSEMYLTPDEFGAILHRSADTITQWEKSKRAPDAVTDGFIRLLAADKLKLDKVDPAEISEKIKPVKRTRRMHIESVGRRYRLAA